MQPQIFTVPICQLASGDRLQLQVYRFVGQRFTSHHPEGPLGQAAPTGPTDLTTREQDKQGKKVYIQANLHGAEVSGNVVIHHLLEYLQTCPATALQGEIWLVPMCNPLSVNQRTHFYATGRYNPYDGRDWNRIFWDYEQYSPPLEDFARPLLQADLATIQQRFRREILASFERTHQQRQNPSALPLADLYRYRLQSLALDADYVLDLHSSSNQAIDYLYCCRGREASAPYFGLDFGIIFDQYDGNAFDEAFLKPWLALEDTFAKLGRSLQFDLESWTLELGSGMALSLRSIDQGWRGILNYLAYKDVLTESTAIEPTAIEPTAIESTAIEPTAIEPTATESAAAVESPASSPSPPPPLPLVPKSQLKKYYAASAGLVQNSQPLGQRVQVGDRLYSLLSFNRNTKLPTITDVRAEAGGLVFDRATNPSVNQGEYVLSIAEGITAEGITAEGIKT